MKTKSLNKIIIFFVVFFCSMIFKTIYAEASIASESQNYTLGETCIGNTGFNLDGDDYKFTISKKSHVSWDITTNSGATFTLYNSNGQVVISHSNFIWTYNTVTEKMRGQGYRTLPEGTYYLHILWAYEGYTFRFQERNVNIPITAHAWNSGIVTKKATCATTGMSIYTCTVCGATKTETVAKTGTHAWGSWTSISEATVFAAKRQARICSVCKATEIRNVGSPLRPTIKLTANSLRMKKKQSTTKFKVSGMAKGDSLATVASSNKKVLKVSKVSATGTFKLTAQNKTGDSTLTIKLASGLTKKVKVTVQAGTVKTTKILGLTNTLTLKKGKKMMLSPTINPITSQQKVTYGTSNKKVATVTSKGVITAKKAGTAKITVKSGNKKAIVKVKVTN